MTLQQSKLQNPKSKIGRRGFSFVEVLFAVMILGIGFILIAGVFPVAIAQTQSNGDETVGAAVARNAVRYLESVPVSRLFPTDPNGAMYFDNDVHVFGPDSDHDQALWEYIKGNVIQPDDTRYGWVAFYRRGVEIPVSAGPAVPAGYAQVIVIACRNRIGGVYDTKVPKAAETNLDLGKTGSWTPYPNLGGKQITATFNYGTTPDAPDVVAVDSSSGQHLAMAPGTFIVLGHDGGAPPNTANGWVVRAGNQAVDSNDNPIQNQWELLPGNDFKNTTYRPTAGSSVRAYIVGQGVDPSDNTFKGGAQDVAVYTTFIQLQ